MTIDPAAAAWFGLACVALWMKGLALSSVQVAARVRARAFARPEDAALLGVTPSPEPPIVALLAGAWRNEHESTPAFLALGAAHVLLGGDASPFGVAVLGFVAARVLQGIAQARRLQPTRTIAFLLGVAATAGVAVGVVVAIARTL